ncbi:ribose-phosphate diphosphokinase [Candidatus Woesearchaeota archaeon]|nr:ribose-phosphate diphosphokinase [Candidatus Woesearchaeota archaeon]
MAESRGKLNIFACDSGEPLAKKVYKKLVEKAKKAGDDQEINYISSRETQFANSEFKHTIDESIRGSDVYIIQDVENSVLPYSVNDNYVALKTAIKSVKRSQPRYITPVIPVFPYARQDKSPGREGINAKMIAKSIEGITRKVETVVTLDIHNEAIAGFFDEVNLENLHASKQITEFIKDNYDLSNLLISSTDVGGIERADHYARVLGVPLGMVHKKRDYSKANSDIESVEETTFLGDCKGKDVVFIDDMIDTGGTIINDANLLLNLKDTYGNDVSAKSVSAACSLPLFNGPCVERFDKAYEEGILRCVIRTDAVYHGDDFSEKHSWDRKVSIVSYLAKVIYNLNHNLSLSALLK